MSMIDNMDSDSRALIQGKSFESYVLILNFSDAHIITLNYLLETPIEVTTIEFHPENPNLFRQTAYHPRQCLAAPLPAM